MDLFGDQLIDAIDRKGSAICVGIDPMLDSMPDEVAGAALHDAGNIDASIDAIFAFTTKVLQIVAPHVACVKFQSAYFEKFLWEGVQAYYELIQEAKELGLLVIGDVKRGDIGSTSAAYAAAHLADLAFSEQDEFATPDAITINPMLGLDAIDPFVQVARESGKGLFVLVRTSNPGSGMFQDVKLADGRSWSELLADELNRVAGSEGLVGSSGYSSLGAVVGATQPHTMRSLRDRLPKSIFLLPGYGTQGATAEMTKAAFRDGKGAIVSASRSILYAHSEKKYADRFGDDWEKCVEGAVLEMKASLQSIVG